MAHERELLGVPEISIIYGTHKDIREDDTNILIDLQPQRVVKAGRSDQVPVQTPREKTHALIVTRTAEYVAEDGVVVVGQTEDRETGKQGEYP